MRKFCYGERNNKDKLIDFVAKKFPYHSRSEWQKHIKSGKIKVNNQVITTNYLLKNHDLISYALRPEEEPKVDKDYIKLYEDIDIIVVSKNANIPISPSGKYFYNTLLNVIKEKERLKDIYAVHRLDRETSGVVVLAKNKHSCRNLCENFAEGKVKKTYHAILKGSMQKREILVDFPIKRNQGESKIKVRQITCLDGKPAKTLFKKLSTKYGVTSAKIKTFTGRNHQIRCHAWHVNLPVLGDKLYGRTDQQFLDWINKNVVPVFYPFGVIERQLLHAYELCIVHPTTKKLMKWQYPAREYFSKILSVKNLSDLIQCL